MPTIKLPDGKNLSFSKKITGLEIAEKISKSLSKQALVMSVDDQLKDLSHLIENDCSIKIFTSKDSEGLETIRHDTAHILAMAVQELFPGTQVTIGPVIENGFYYDFARKEPFTQEDLNKIENKMKEIVDRNEPTFREVWKRNKAISHFKGKGEIYKAEIIEGILENEDVSNAYYARKEWLRTNKDTTPKSNDLNLQNAFDKIDKLRAELESTKAKNKALIEQFVRWQYNLYMMSINMDQPHRAIGR